MMNDYQTEENFIDKEFIQKWRRDIVKLTPVIKVNCKGKNIVGHSAPFPDEIPEMAIRYFSGVGDLVVDIFSGSGTTCRVAKRLNRNYIGFELNADYCKASQEMLKNI
jgi:DNA modification methylase